MFDTITRDEITLKTDVRGKMKDLLVDDTVATVDNLEKYRALFPHTKDRVYLNHAALAPMHKKSLYAIQRSYFDRAHHNPEYWPDVLEVKGKFKNLVGRLIHGDSKYIAVTDSTSMGLNWLAQGLTWKSGDRILLNNFEFPSNVYPFMNLKQQGVALDFVEHRQGSIKIEDIADKIRPETRLLSISYVEFLNGYRNDLKAIGELCREKDILFCVDGIQGLGALEMDVEEMQIDFLANGGQKWMMWPLGTAFMYIAPRIFDDVKPMAAGWLAVEDSWDFFDYQLNFLPTADRFEPGMFNVAGVVGASASLEMFLEVGPHHIERTILETTGYLISRLQDNGYQLFTHLEPEVRSGIVSFFHTRSPELYEFLMSNNTHVSLRDGYIRVSPHFYNTEEDIDQLMDLVLRFDAK